MPTQITQIDDEINRTTICRVEGELFAADAVLLQKITRDLHKSTGNSIVIDLADLDFLDSESAPTLLDLQRNDGFEIIGTEIFLQTIVNEAERRMMS